MTPRLAATPERTGSFDAKLAAYALAGGAMLFNAAPAQAGLIIVNPTEKPSFSIPTDGGVNAIQLDMDNDGFVDFIFLGGSTIYPNGNGLDFTSVSGDSGLGFITSITQECGCYPLAVNFGTIADALASAPNLSKSKLLVRYTYNGVPYFYGNWQNGLQFNGILGVSFLLGNTTPTQGFIDVSVEIGSASVTVNQWGYLTVDDVSVPEPSSMAMFALGAAGVAAMRRRKAQ